jgi:serine phosphatase RsbU (regulator of sigma subunit)
MSIRVQVTSPSGAPAEYAFDGPDIVIGRAVTSAIVIPDSRVSRQHARLVLRAGDWFIEDLGARNRTLLNGRPVEGSVRLSAGDELAVGDAIIRVLGGPTAPGTDTTASRWESPSAPTVSLGGDRDAARMWTINEIHRALAEPMTLAALLDFILARCFDVLHPEEGAILLRGADGTLATAASRRQGGAGRVSVPRRLIEEVAGKGRPALVLDAAYDERFAGSDSIVMSGIRSIVAAPLVDAEGTLGLITLCSRLTVRKFAQPDLDMLVSIASAAALRVRNVALVDELAARRVIEHELALAHDVQMSMLPREIPQRPELTIGAQLKPARSVGGDLYDFVIDGDRLWFIVADVAGKSIAAALYMAIVKTLFRAMARDGADVDDVAARMNRELARDNERMMFVTAAVGCLDLESGALALVDAGHNPVVVIDPAARLGGLDVSKGIALGVVADARYIAARVVLDRGATLVLYTDGMTDARDTAGRMFGEERLLQAIAAAAADPPDKLVAAVMGTVECFAAGAPAEDDLTILALRYTGAPRRPVPGGRHDPNPGSGTY